MIPPLAPTFEAALRDVRAQRPRFRSAAAVRLGDPPPGRRDEAVAGLLILAVDTDGGVRQAAYEALGELAAPEGLDTLLEAFDDPNPEARQAAVLAAGRVSPGQCADVIGSLLEDPRPEMRFSAVWTLSRLGAEHADRLVPGLRDEDDEIRLLTVECLGELGVAKHADDIAALLEDPSDAVRFGAATALAALGDARGAPALRMALARPDRAFPAAIGLGDLEDHASLEALTRLATQRWRSPILRAAAARALARLGDPLGAQVIGKIVRSWRIEARQYAVQLVGELKLTSLLPEVTRAFRRSRAIERPVYEATLEQLAPESAEARELLDSLRQANQPV